MPALHRNTTFWTCLLAAGLGSASMACGETEATQWVEIQSALTLGGQPARCAQPYDGDLGLGRSFELADARVYLSQIELFETGLQRWQPMRLEENAYQRDGVVLLDFENGTGACASFGSAGTYEQIQGWVPPGRYSGLRFSVGLPFEHNHIDPHTAQGPFAEAGMFWTWQGGYKFLKFDFQAESQGKTPIQYNVHLGSTGCGARAPMIAPQTPCARPNLGKASLLGFDPSTQSLEIRLDSLIAPQLTGAESSPGCMGDPSSAAHCDPVMKSLGLDPVSGQCIQDCQTQQLFVAGGKR